MAEWLCRYFRNKVFADGDICFQQVFIQDYFHLLIFQGNRQLAEGRLPGSRRKNASKQFIDHTGVLLKVDCFIGVAFFSNEKGKDGEEPAYNRTNELLWKCWCANWVTSAFQGFQTSQALYSYFTQSGRA